MKKLSSRKKVFIVFGDIRGFGSYQRRSRDRECCLLMDKVDPEYERFAAHFKGTRLVKINADGFMVVISQEGKPKKLSVEILKECWGTLQRVLELIAKNKYPRPDGFRIRVSYGDSIERLTKRGVDFLGYQASMTFKLLHVNPKMQMIIHQSVKELVSPTVARKMGFEFHKLPLPAYYPGGIDPEDIEGLYSFEMKSEPSQ